MEFVDYLKSPARYSELGAKIPKVWTNWYIILEIKCDICCWLSYLLCPSCSFYFIYFGNKLILFLQTWHKIYFWADKQQAHHNCSSQLLITTEVVEFWHVNTFKNGRKIKGSFLLWALQLIKQMLGFFFFFFFFFPFLLKHLWESQCGSFLLMANDAYDNSCPFQL